ncbi:von Willebrand factor D and EGF domain-containing protein-like [Mytilus edulis]|uniref:von Willebrand factor D and EGF domain-containing protein-like n=1 Tax=Mytilus edulis TaxID=6550 RepID=UPI0039F09276
MENVGCVNWLYPTIILLFRLTTVFSNEPIMAVAKVKEVHIVDLNNEDDIIMLADNLPWAYMIDYHKASGFIYWTDTTANTISRINYQEKHTNSTVETVINSAKHPFGIAVDNLNSKIYWSDSVDKSLSRSELNGSNLEVLLKDENFGSLGGISLDTVNSWIFFTNEPGNIEKCKLDGSMRQLIITSADYPLNIALDVKTETLFWTDIGLHQIKSATFDGNNIKTIVDAQSPLGIDIYNDFIYYSQWKDKEIYKINKDGTNKLLLYTSASYVRDIVILQDGMCGSYNSLQVSNKRSIDYITDLSLDVPISDHALEMGWYRMINDNGDQIPTSPPGLLHCGTIHPIWLNGTLPVSEEGNVSRQVCVQSSSDICEYTITIEINNCGGYFLYYLDNTPANSSFCFGAGAVFCPDGMSSDTGYYPGCTSNFPKEIVPVNVAAVLIEGQSYSIPIHGNQYYPSLLPVFRCNFTDASEGSYVYDVLWYINGVHVISHFNVPFSNINTTDLRDTDWINQFKMNMEVKCAIRIRYTTNSVPGLHLYSQPYQAGVYPDKYEYTVIEGESIDITFTSTVPVGCISSHEAIRTHCDQNFYIFQPKNDQTSVSCRNNIAKKDVVFQAQFCGINIKSLHWNNENKLRVYGFSDSMYNFQDRSTILKISTSAVSELNDIWKGIQVPDIKVTVIDKDAVLINRQCRSYNDPHITTFDGRLYHYMDVGEFVMYKNDKGPYSVHALFTNCGFGWVGSSCHCGIAVRSRNSLFVLRTCQTISRTEKHLLQEPITQLRSCDENDLVIEHDTNNYKITLPIGTEIKFTISRWSKFITMIAIKPSVFDINEARGLCGIPSTTKDQSDDFTHRQNGPVDNDQDFADSWRITPSMLEEQLFSNEPAFLSYSDDENDNSVTEENSSHYCTCERQAGSTDKLEDFNTVHCNLTESTEFCSESFKTEEDTVSSFYTSCSISKRKKRSVNSSDKIIRRSIGDDADDDVIDAPPLTYDESVYSSEVTVPETFKNGWTEETALQTCMEKINNALPTELTNLVDVSVTEFVESCVLDIKLVGDTTFLPDTIGTMLTYIMTEVLRNESLYILNTTDGSQTLVEYFTSLMCPNNCSDNGNCTMGVCLCNGKYVGDDCSQSISIPPSNTSIPFDGLCTLGTRNCRSTNVYGNFISKIVWYKLKYFQIVTDSVTYISEDAVFEANFRNMFMVSVDFESSRRKREASETFMAEGYEISLSYDGTSFGESTRIIIYEETCYSCNSTSIECVELDTCNPTVVPITENDDKKSFVVMAAALGSFFLVIILVIGFIYYKVKSNNTRTKIIPDQKERNLHLEHSTGSHIWMSTDKSISDLELEFDDSRGETPFEMFEKQLPPLSHYKHNI